MSTSRKTVKVTPELIDEIVKRAHRERAEAIAELFGFGFTAMKDAVKAGLGQRSTTTDTSAAGSAR